MLVARASVWERETGQAGRTNIITESKWFTPWKTNMEIKEHGDHGDQSSLRAIVQPSTSNG